MTLHTIYIPTYIESMWTSMLFVSHALYLGSRVVSRFPPTQSTSHIRRHTARVGGTVCSEQKLSTWQSFESFTAWCFADLIVAFQIIFHIYVYHNWFQVVIYIPYSLFVTVDGYILAHCHYNRTVSCCVRWPYYQYTIIYYNNNIIYYTIIL